MTWEFSVAVRRFLHRNSSTRSTEQFGSVRSGQAENRRFYGSRWLKHGAVAGAFFVVTFLAYSNSFRTGFPLDNDPIILQDPRIHAATAQNVSLIMSRGYWWMPPEKGLYRPFTTLTYLFNYAILGNAIEPEGYHYFNFLLHFINVLLCYGLALTVLRKFWPAVFIAAIWAVHPVLTESVTNIIGRADLLAAFGVLSGLWMYVKSRESSGLRRAAWLFGVMAATGIGIYSKESAIAILGLMALYEITWPKDRERLRPLAFGWLAAVPPIVAFLYERAAVLARSTVPVFPHVDNPLIDSSFLVSRLTAVKVLAKYIYLLTWPAKLSWNYYFNEIPLAHGTSYDWVAWSAVAVVAVGVCFAFRRNRAVFFFAALAFIALFPVSNLVVKIGSIMAERFLYLPSIGFAACVVIASYALAGRVKSRALAPVVLCLCIVALGVRTRARNLDWQDNNSLALAGVLATPDSFASHFALAKQLYASDPGHRNIDRVIEEAEKSLAILDSLPDLLNFPTAYADAGMFYQAKGDSLRPEGPDGMAPASGESLLNYRRAIQILLRSASIVKTYDDEARAVQIARGAQDPQIPSVASKNLYPELGLTYMRLGDSQAGFAAAQAALHIDPAQPETYVLEANILMSEKRYHEALVTFLEAYMVSGDHNELMPVYDLYREGLDSQGCAVSEGADGMALNTFCAPVHRDICTAEAGLLRIETEADRFDMVEELKATTAGELGCSPERPLK